MFVVAIVAGAFAGLALVVSAQSYRVARRSLLLNQANRDDMLEKDKIRWRLDVEAVPDHDPSAFLVSVINQGRRPIGFKGWTLQSADGTEAEILPTGGKHVPLERIEDGDAPWKVLFDLDDVYGESNRMQSHLTFAVEDIDGQQQERQLR